MRVVCYGRVPSATWEEACEASDEAWLFHRYAWVGLEGRRVAAAQQSFAVLDASGQALALVPLYVFELGLGSFSERLLASGLRSSGIALRGGGDVQTCKAIRSLIMREIERRAVALDCDRVQLGTSCLAPANAGRSDHGIPFWMIEHGYEPGLQMGRLGMAPAPGMATCAFDQVIDIAAEDEKQFGRLDPECRRAVRKAWRAGVSLVEVRGAEAVARYRRLAQRSATRTGETLPEEEYHAELAAALEPAGRLCVLFARRDEMDAAALMLGVDKGGASFLAGVSDPGQLEHRVNDYLHFEVLRWCRRHGIARYRLGPVFPTLPTDWPVARVSRFKGKFGARSIPVAVASRFLRPERYFEIGVQALRERCAGSSASTAGAENTGAGTESSGLEAGGSVSRLWLRAR